MVHNQASIAAAGQAVAGTALRTAVQATVLPESLLSDLAYKAAADTFTGTSTSRHVLLFGTGLHDEHETALSCVVMHVDTVMFTQIRCMREAC